MGEQGSGLWRRLLRAAAAALAGLVAACSGDPQNAAPVFLKGAVPEAAEAAPPALGAPARRIVVRPGQSLSRIAHEYRVSERAIIAANRLKPPYKIEIGQNLLIPVAAAPPVRIA